MATFADAFRLMVAYPRTKSLDAEDFRAPTCYYTCEERDSHNAGQKSQCDFKLCEEFVKTLPVFDTRVNRFVNSLIQHVKTETSTLPDKFDGFHVQYTPWGQEKAMNIVNLRRQDEPPQKAPTRTAVVELNEKRFQHPLGYESSR